MENYGRSQSVADGRIIDNCASAFIDNYGITSYDMYAAGEIVQSDSATIAPRDAGRVLLTPGMSNIIDVATGELIPNFSSFRNLPETDSPSLNLIPSEQNTIDEYLNRFRFTPLAQDEVDRALADSWRPYERFSLVMNGHVDLGGMNREAYFEGYYFNRQNKVIGATEQLAPTILGSVPSVDGSNNPIYYDAGTGLSVNAAGTPVTDATGARVNVRNPLNPFPADIGLIVTIDDAPQTFDTELQQSRLVAGLTGDITDDGRWSYDVSASYDRATGFVSQPILLENHLFFASQTVGAVATQDLCAGATCGTGQVDGDPRFVLDATGAATDTPVWTQNPSGEVVCGGDVVSDVVGVFTIPDCVPTDWMNASIGGDPLNGVSGHFATQAEKDYLIQNRTNRTVTELMVLEGYVFGDLFDIPTGGTVGTAFGIQWREDQIDSQHSAVGVLGLNNAENPGQEGETRGSRTTFDAYAEISAPVIIDAAWADLLQIDAAVRFTDDENFGNETVYKIGALWDINEYLSFNTSFNTSFRAPNLREQFLADQAGALSGSVDPCRVALVDLMDPGPNKDRLIANCTLSGADVTVLGNPLTVAIPTTTGGAAGLNPETSESFTATISASQPWTERFDFDIALTYFDIQIEDTVRSLEPGTIVNRCYFDQDGLASPFCAFVERNRPTATPNLNFISLVRAGFVNTGEESATGMDISTRLLFDIGETTMNWSTATTIMNERLSQEFPPSEAMPNGSTVVDDVGRIGNPETTFQSTLAVTFRDWDFVWQARWWSDTEFFAGLPITDVDGGCLQGCPLGEPPADHYENFTEFQYRTSSLIRDEFGPVVEVTEAEGQWQHDLAATYSMETMTFTLGINNVADEEPPCVSWNAGPNRNCAVSSARYDLVGRSYFLRFTADF
jgi:iron complex outermembrane receptor protein